jgi:hypothetical protein
MNKFKDVILHVLVALQPKKDGMLTNILDETKAVFSNSENFTGHKMTFLPLTESTTGEKKVLIQDELKPVSLSVKERLEYTLNFFKDAIDVVASKELTNTETLAELNIGDKSFNVPAGVLLSIQKKIPALRNVLKDIPTARIDRKWNKSDDPNYRLVTEPFNVTSTIKEEYGLVLAPPVGEKIAAQVIKAVKDVPVGTKSTIYFSSQLTSREKSEILHNLDILDENISAAIQKANSIPVKECVPGEAIVNFLLQPIV